MTHVLVRNGLVVKTIRGVGALTAAESANGGVRRELASGVTEVFIGGTASVNRAGVVTAISDPVSLSKIDLRRASVKARLRVFDHAPAANWALRDAAAGRRAENYWKWLEMIGAGSSVDANLRSDTIWADIQTELNFQPDKWYRDHAEAGWTALSLATLTTGAWYRTNATTGAAEIVARVTMPSSWSGLVPYIYS